MGIVTTHTEGRVVTHSDDDRLPIDVVQLPARDAAIQGGESEAAASPAAPTTTLSEKSRARTPAAKAALKQAAKRTRKART